MPMNGKTAEEITYEQAELFAEFARETHLTDYELIPTGSSHGQPRDDREAMGALAASLALMADADAVYFSRDYESARGCRIEFEAATQYHIPVFVEA